MQMEMNCSACMDMMMDMMTKMVCCVFREQSSILRQWSCAFHGEQKFIVAELFYNFATVEDCVCDGTL